MIQAASEYTHRLQAFGKRATRMYRLWSRGYEAVWVLHVQDKVRMERWFSGPTQPIRTQRVVASPIVWWV